jgi:hypothetical protein
MAGSLLEIEDPVAAVLVRGMGYPAGVRRDFAALERRRMEAAQLLRQGVSQSQVARAVGVHRMISG